MSSNNILKEEDTFNNFRHITEKLPTYAYKSEIISCVRKNLVTIIVGETGSGKSTQIPQYLVDSQELTQILSSKSGEVDNESILKKPLKICVTQPRRMAAVAMARRVATERNVKVGEEVGYTIRFDDQSSKDLTHIKFVTDGIALREILQLGHFNKYQFFMVDEAHERSLHTDILFSLIKKNINQFNKNEKLPNIRFIITSATLDVNKFSTFLNNAPVLKIPGKLFPVEIIYAPISEKKLPDLDSTSNKNISLNEVPSSYSIIEAATNAALKLHLLDYSMSDTIGHILVFLTGKAECDLACEMLLKRMSDLVEASDSNIKVGDAIVLPLYGALSTADQTLVFEPTEPGVRKIIFATNIAETSVTVEDVEFVVDMGLVKHKICNPKNGVESLKVVWISKSQALQRCGRAGRLRSGKCIRIYSQVQYEEFLDSPVLEIHRSNLSGVVLQLKVLGFNDVLSVEFIDPPPKESVIRSLKSLYYIEAISSNGNLTDIGRRIVSLPLDPVQAKCLVTARKYNVEHEVAAIISMLSVDSFLMFHCSVEKKESKFEKHDKRYTDKRNRKLADKYYKKHKEKPSLRKNNEDQIKNSTVNGLDIAVYEKFIHPKSEHITLLNVFNHFINLNTSETKQWCDKYKLPLRGLNQAKNIYTQIMKLLYLESSSQSVDQFSSNDKEALADDSGSSLNLTSEKLFFSQKKFLNNEKIDDILISLCTGFFLNSAKLSNSYYSKPLFDFDSNMKSQKIPLWVTYKDGLVMRCDPTYCVLDLSTPFEFIIFNEAVSKENIFSHSKLRNIGMMRIVSAVKYSWIKNFITLFNKVDLRKLTQSNHTFNLNNSTDKNNLSQSENYTDEYRLCRFDRLKSLKDCENTELDKKRKKEEEIQRAKERYMERKKRNITS